MVLVGSMADVEPGSRQNCGKADISEDRAMRVCMLKMGMIFRAKSID
jgi:hypothetical protein